MVDIAASIRLLRPVNCLMVGFAVLVGEIIVHKTVLPLPTLLGFITGFTLTGAAMVSNDYWDRKVDAVNSPARPIPSGRVKPREAATFTVLLSAAGLTAAYLTNLPSFLTASTGLLMFVLYNYRVKLLGLLGNMLVSASLALPLLYGGVIHPQSSASTRNLTLLVFFELMIFLANTGREVNKGISDIEGDRVRNVSTVARKHGPKAAAQLSAVLYLVAVALSPLPLLLNLVSWLYIPLVAIADLGLVASAFILLKDYSKQNALKVKRMALLWMLLGLLSFVAGALQ